MIAVTCCVCIYVMYRIPILLYLFTLCTELPLFVVLPLNCCIQIYFYYRQVSIIYFVQGMYTISGGGRTYTCVIQRASGGAECAVRCVHMCSVGMGQGN
jgi:hypothetical protein